MKKMELSSKVPHHCAEDHNESRMEVTENVKVPAHPGTVPEELQLLEEPKMAGSTEESRPPTVIVDSITGPPGTLVSFCEESTVCPKEHSAVERV